MEKIIHDKIIKIQTIKQNANKINIFINEINVILNVY